VNVGGLKNVVQAAKETKTIEKIIYTSSMVALGSTDGYVADESQVSNNTIWFRLISPRWLDLKLHN
jgi:farnesol dehydrogenase